MPAIAAATCCGQCLLLLHAALSLQYHCWLLLSRLALLWLPVRLLAVLLLLWCYERLAGVGAREDIVLS